MTEVRAYADIPEAERLARWRELALANVRGLTPENADAMAALCVATEREKGAGSISVWHASAVVHGHLDRCQCGLCVLTPAEFARQVSFREGHLSQARQGLADRSGPRAIRGSDAAPWRDQVAKAERELADYIRIYGAKFAPVVAE